MRVLGVTRIEVEPLGEENACSMPVPCTLLRCATRLSIEHVTSQQLEDARLASSARPVFTSPGRRKLIQFAQFLVLRGGAAIFSAFTTRQTDGFRGSSSHESDLGVMAD